MVRLGLDRHPTQFGEFIDPAPLLNGSGRVLAFGFILHHLSLFCCVVPYSDFSCLIGASFVSTPDMNMLHMVAAISLPEEGRV